MTRGRAIAWAAAALALWAAAAAAAAIPAPVPGAGRDTLRVPATIRPAVVKLGERVRVRLAVPLPEPGARIIGPPASSSFGAVDVLASGPAEAGRDSAGWEMVVALFEPGDQDLTALPFALRSSTGERPLRLLAYTLSVETTIPDTAGDASLRDIRGPVKVQLRWRWGRCRRRRRRTCPRT
mgnify:FL=1